MGPLRPQKTGWLYDWRNCGVAGAKSYAAFFTNARVGSNIMYSYDDLKDVLHDPFRTTQIPHYVIRQALADYPLRTEQTGQEAA